MYFYKYNNLVSSNFSVPNKTMAEKTAWMKTNEANSTRDGDRILIIASLDHDCVLVAITIQV